MRQLSILHPALLLFLAVALHFVAVFSGLYDAQTKQGFVWFDNILHIMVGVAFGLLWVWIMRNQPVSYMFVAASLVVFVLMVAIGWEIAEFIFFKIFDSYALGLKVYSPSLTEAVFDALSDLIGALFLAAFVIVRKSDRASTQ